MTTSVEFRTGDSQSVYAATTFGLLISHDDCAFHWICPDAIGYGGTFDPKYRVAADGTIFATTFAGLRISRDGGCSFTTATVDAAAGSPGRLAGVWVDAIDIGPTGEVWVVTADGSRANDIYRSTDNGRTFAPRGLFSRSIWWRSVAVAPARAERIYATGYQVAGRTADGRPLPATHFAISDDSGAHWRESALTGVRLGTPPLVFVLAVDRSDPEIVVMASAGANPPHGDRLYRSTDGGTTWRDVLATTGSIRSAAIVSSGPAGQVLVATRGGGAFRSLDGGASFARIADAPQLDCIGQRGDGQIFGCAANWEPDHAAIMATADGTAWTKRLQLHELAGPIDCPAGTAEHDACASQWPALQQQLGARGPAACTAISAAAPALAAYAAATGSAGSSAVSPASPASGGGRQAPSLSPTGPTAQPSGCCSAGLAGDQLAGLAAIIALVSVAVFRIPRLRRRRSQR